MSVPVTERCIDGSPHKYVFLSTRTQEIRWHVWAKIDTFFCEKCLKYVHIEAEIPNAPRW